MKEIIPQELIERLNQAVKRNIRRFPEDFMFQLNDKEFEIWRSQFVTSKSDRIGLRRAPYAFTEQGVAMLSSVLKSERAIQVNIAIMRAFVRLKQVFATHKELAAKLKELEGEVGKHNKLIIEIFEIIKQLTRQPVPQPKPKGPIGFTKYSD